MEAFLLLVPTRFCWHSNAFWKCKLSLLTATTISIVVTNLYSAFQEDSSDMIQIEWKEIIFEQIEFLGKERQSSSMSRRGLGAQVQDVRPSTWNLCAAIKKGRWSTLWAHHRLFKSRALNQRLTAAKRRHGWWNKALNKAFAYGGSVGYDWPPYSIVLSTRISY